MELKKFINEDMVYLKVENEIREWVEKTYPGLSIEFEPHLEIVRTDTKIDFSPAEVEKIVEVVNIKIGDIMELHQEEIYIAERLTRIWRNHPRFNIDVSSIQDIKNNSRFCKYLKELIIKTKVHNIANYGKREAINE